MKINHLKSEARKISDTAEPSLQSLLPLKKQTLDMQLNFA